jgi:hypothetical protein
MPPETVAVLDLLTVSTTVLEVLPLCVLLPLSLYTAVREWLPVLSDELVMIATPSFNGALPMTTPASRKVTVPVAPPGVTVAESVTACPNAGFGETERVVGVEDWFTARFTA